MYYEETEPQWLFTQEEFNKYTPSRIEGMSYDTEITNRRKGINFIIQVGISLKLDQITLATASIYFQRFYMRHPLQIPNTTKGAHHYQVAATAVYVAYKSKENPRKMHELIVAVSRVAQKDPNLMIDEQSKEFWKWRETIQHHENLMLEVLCFDLDPGLPYQILYEFLKTYNVQDNKRLRNVSWAVVTDSFTTILCLLVQPQSIAGGALHLGLRHGDIKLPDDEYGRPWWEALGLNTEEMSTVLECMLSTYESSGLPRQAPGDAYVRDADTMVFEHTRMPTPGGSVVEGDGEGMGEKPGEAENGSGGDGERDGDKVMEDVRSNGRSGSEEGELG